MRRIIPAAPLLVAVAFLAACGNVRMADGDAAPPRPGASSGKAPSLADIDIPYQKHVLPNGLTVIIHEDHKAPVAAVNLWYHVGSKDEKPGKTGFAHLFEHLMFNGSENFNDEFFRPLEKAGATKVNGTTWLDRTNYFQNVPTSALDLALWLESDRMGHLLGAIDQKKLDEQRGVVQNEKRQGDNEPYGKVGELISASTYPAGHPYSWDTIGSMEDLNAASLADVKEWFSTYYGASNVTLVVAGDVEPAAILKRIEHYFGDVPPGPPIRRHQEWIAKMTGERRASLQDRVPQARLYKVWNVPGKTRRDFTLLDLYGDVLAGSKNSRLYKRLVYQDQIATGVSAGLGPFEIGSQFIVDVMAKPGVGLDVVEKAVNEEMRTLLRDGPTQDELDRIKTVRYAATVRGLERVDGFGGKSHVLAESQTFGGSPDFYKQRLRWVQDATRGDLREAAQRWLADGTFVLHVVPVPEHVAAKGGADRSKPPATGTPPELKLPPLQRGTLSNGLKVVLAERHVAPIVQMNLIVDAGLSADTAEEAGTAKFALNMLDEGTATRDSLGIARRLEELGAGLSTGSIQDTSYINLSAIKTRLDESVELFADVILRPSFPEKDFARLKAIRLADIQQEKVSPDGIAFRIYRKLLFGPSHAYGNAGSGNGTETTVGALTTDKLRAFHRRWVRPDNATLLVAGDTTLAEVTPILEKYFAGWKAPAEPKPAKNVAPVALPPRPRVFLVNRSGSEQSLILAAHTAPPKSDPDDIPMQAANTALGGLFTSRINMNLREDKHWSYGASSGLVEARGPRPFIAYASVQSDKTAESMVELRKELVEAVGKRPLKEAELEQARKALVLSLPGENETTPDVAGSFLNILTFGLPDSYYNDYVGKVRELTVAQANAALKRLVQPQALTWVVVGDLAKTEAAIRKLGFGEVKVLDVDGTELR
jgi:zinc protease